MATKITFEYCVSGGCGRISIRGYLSNNKFKIEVGKGWLIGSYKIKTANLYKLFVSNFNPDSEDDITLGDITLDKMNKICFDLIILPEPVKFDWGDHEYTQIHLGGCKVNKNCTFNGILLCQQHIVDSKLKEKFKIFDKLDQIKCDVTAQTP